MVYKQYKDIQLSMLGMGNMRLPKVTASGEAIDYKEAFPIIERAYNEGINYFDTAYVYNSGDSEKCVGECMKQFDRSTFYLATKFNIGANPDYKAVFETQLERLQTDYIDFYLIHCVLDGNCDRYLESGAIEYFLEKQKEGKIKYLGFSSHASVETLEKFADHHQWDFAQIQLNYFDWNYSTAKAEYEALVSRNIPIIVMEPVRGGRLAELCPEAEGMLKAAHPDWSIASWALRFVKSLPGVNVILSGMSDTAQVADNLNTFSTDDVLSDEDMKLLMDACDTYKKYLSVPCTACRYCTADCPMQINIPEFIRVYNAYKVNGSGELKACKDIETDGHPADCIGCGACMGHCPQGIDIPSIMTEMAEKLNK